MTRLLLTSSIAALAACGHAIQPAADEVDRNVAQIEALFATNATLRSVCERADVDGFRYFLFRDPAVRQLFVGPAVDVIRPGRDRQSVRREHYAMPSFGIDRGVETVDDASAGSGWLKVDIRPLADGAFQMEWVRAEYELQGAAAMPIRLARTFGPVGRLTFVRTSQCWEVRNDEIADSSSVSH